jgi:pseudaminic acid cytidylyltransferase
VKISKIAIIPARAGSKRLPKKNILNFLGDPIIVHTIRAAINSKIFDEIIVSTDCKIIKKISKKFPVKIHNRLKKFATDRSTINELCTSLIKENQKIGNIWDIICVLYPTAPLRTSNDIKNTVKLISKDTNFAVGVTTFDHYPHHALVSKNKKLIPVWPKLINIKKFKNGKFLVDNGSTYAAKVNSFLKYKSFLGPKAKGHIMPKLRSIDIDTKEDYLFLLNSNRNHNIKI